MDFTNIKSHYRTGVNDISKEFFYPCLSECVTYKRAVGYFSSKAITTWAEALAKIAESDDVEIQLLISPQLTKADIDALKLVTSAEEKQKLKDELVDNILKDVLSLVENPGLVGIRIKLFAWLIATGRLDLKFAFAAHIDDPGIYHEKIGVFTFPDGKKIAFTGSANETEGGYVKNYETIDVFRSWDKSDIERVRIKEEQFDEAWKEIAPGLEVHKLSEKSVQFIKEIAPSAKPILKPETPKPEEEPEEKVDVDKWRHQEEACNAFLKNGYGVLEMATGTGKTRTAFKVLDNLLTNDKIDSVVICTEGTDLIDQWCEELADWGINRNPRMMLLKHYGKHHEIGDYVLDSKHSILAVSRANLEKLFSRIEQQGLDLNRTCIVHDEVHGLGTPSLRRALSGRLKKFKYRLGLSATPDREYDDDGSDFIEKEVGPIVFQFNIEDAIERGILCEFDYHALEYTLTDRDRNRISQVYSKKAARAKNGNPMSKEEVWIEISKVYKTAEMKPAVFMEYLTNNPEILKSAIIFVETKEYGERLLGSIHNYTHLYRTYYAEDDKQNLIDFSNGEIDCLITCHKISQGIDIQSLRNVILFASARARLETIQRIGRCIRFNPLEPDKRAFVLDFVRPQDEDDGFLNADQDRFEWLTNLSKIRRK